MESDRLVWVLDENGIQPRCNSDALRSSQEETYFDLETSRRSYGQGFKIFLGLYVGFALFILFVTLPYGWIERGEGYWNCIKNEAFWACFFGPFILGFGIAYFPSFFRKIRLVVAPESRVVLLESVSLRSDKLISVKPFPIDDILSVDYQDRTHSDGLEKVTIEKSRISLRFYGGHRVIIADTEDVGLALSFSRQCNAAIIRAKGEKRY